MLRLNSLAFWACLPMAAQAVDITFTSDGQIGGTDQYHQVFVYDTPPNRTTVTMTGGSVQQLLQHDTSIFDMYAGYVLGVVTNNLSTANIMGGKVPTALAKDNSTLNFFGGNIGLMQVVGRDNSTINIYGGQFGYLVAVESDAILNLRGGVFSDSEEGPPILVGLDNAIINIYGYGFSYTPEATDLKPYPTLSGYWSDGLPFLLRLDDLQTYDHIRFLPEPTTIGLVSIGWLLISRTPRRVRKEW